MSDPSEELSNHACCLVTDSRVIHALRLPLYQQIKTMRRPTECSFINYDPHSLSNMHAQKEHRFDWKSGSECKMLRQHWLTARCEQRLQAARKISNDAT